MLHATFERAILQERERKEKQKTDVSRFSTHSSRLLSSKPVWALLTSQCVTIFAQEKRRDERAKEVLRKEQERRDKELADVLRRKENDRLIKVRNETVGCLLTTLG